MASMTALKVELTFKVSGLVSADPENTSIDPYVVVLGASGDLAPTEIGRSETNFGVSECEFERATQMEYRFEEKQTIVIKVQDEKGKGDGENEVLGTVTTLMSKVLMSKDATITLDLVPAGKITIIGNEMAKSGRDTVVLRFQGVNLKNLHDTHAPHDTFFRFSKRQKTGKFKTTFESSVFHDSANPTWDTVPRLKVAELTAADLSAKNLRIDVIQKGFFAADSSLGFFEFSFSELLDKFNEENSMFELQDESGNSFGGVSVPLCDINHINTFVEMMATGLTVSFAVAIDFTASNGEPTDSTSLHYVDPESGSNGYIAAINAIANILLEYDLDRQIPMLGFGGTIGDAPQTVFNLNFNEKPECDGVAASIEAYKNAIPKVKLSGSTKLRPVLDRLLTLIEHGANAYTVFVVMIDSDVADYGDVVDFLVSIDSYPVSVVFLGIGPSEFGFINLLADREEHLRSGRKYMERHAASVVETKRYVGLPQAKLSAAALKEVYDQIADWAIVRASHEAK